MDDRLLKFEGEDFKECFSGLSDRVVYVERRGGDYFLIGEDSVILMAGFLPIRFIF